MSPTPWRPFFAWIPRRVHGQWFWGRLERRFSGRPARVPHGLQWVAIEEFRERTQMTTVEILRKARDVLATRGLHKGAPMPKGADRNTCPVCTYGALAVASSGDPMNWCRQDQRRVDEACKLLSRAGSASYGVFLAPWSDAPTTTLEMVLDRFDAAIILAGEG